MLKLIVSTVILILLGAFVWGKYLLEYVGYLYTDTGHLNYYYQQGFVGFPFSYLPWESGHRPIGRHVINLLFWFFGEDPVSILRVQLIIHTINSLILYMIVNILTQSFPLALAGSIVFLTSASSFLPVYWTGALFDLLSTTFILCLTLATLFVTSKRTWIRYLALLGTYLSFLCAVKTKESIIVFVIPAAILFVWLRVNARVFINQPLPIIEFSLYNWVVKLRKNISGSDIIWLGLFAVLTLIMATQVDSDFLRQRTGQIDPAYIQDYSFFTIFRSYGWDLATLFYVCTSAEPIPPLWAFVIIFTIVLLALKMKNFLMLWGMIWWLTLLFFLAALPKQYQSPHYPYPAGIGWVIILVGAVWQITLWFSSTRKQQWARYLISCVMVLICSLALSNWLHYGVLPVWARNFHRDTLSIVSGLKSLIPKPVADAEVIIVAKNFTVLDQNLKVFLSAIYKKTNINGVLYKSLEEGKQAFAQSSVPSRYLVYWSNREFQLISSTVN